MSGDRTYGFPEDELLPISALQHFAFCPRQCALIHLEQAWSENRLTAEGRILHERVHERGHETRGELRMEFGVPLRSLRLGLAGVADVVEFRRENRKEPWRAFPVEYKRGKPKGEACDEIQLCAQAMCLEEMMNCRVKSGAIFYGKTRRRHDVAFDDELRGKVEKTCAELRELLKSGKTPPADYGKRCKSCSVFGLCAPKARKKGPVEEYLAQAVE
ncbi:MAG: CRISPR-associated protein Cas4 [Kiritimatiellia bacterium]